MVIDAISRNRCDVARINHRSQERGLLMTEGPVHRSRTSRAGLSEELLLRLIELCYDAALQPAEWDKFLRLYADVMGASCATLHFARNVKDGIVDDFYADGLPENARNDYTGYYHRLDPWLPGMVGQPTGSVLTNKQLLDQSSFTSSEFYNDFGKPFDLFRINTVILSSDPERFAYVSAFRPEGRDTFSAPELKFTGKLSPHLRRALRTSNCLHARETLVNQFADSLDAMPQPVFLIGEGDKVLHMNTAASSLVGEADGLDVIGGTLTAQLSPAATQLPSLLARALFWSDDPQCLPNNVLSVPRPSGKAPYPLFVTPLGTGVFESFQPRRCVAVFVGDPDRQLANLSERLMAAYALTPVEAQLAEGLVQGGILADLAERIGITTAIAREQLQLIFQKTGTSSQTDLIRQVPLTLGNLPDPSS